MKWKVLYTDWTEYKSEDYRWEDLPELGVQKIFVYTPTGKMIFSGWDVYWILEKRDGSTEVGTWNDDKPEVFNYNKGCVRTFYKNGSVNKKTEYLPRSTWAYVPKNLLKRGELVNKETAKLMGF